MSADRLPPGTAELLAEIESGVLSEGTRATLARALRAAADGGAITEILAASARKRRDDALVAMQEQHFAAVAPSRAAKGMAVALASYASIGWKSHRDRPETPPNAPLRGACYAVLIATGGEAPSWRTSSRALSRYPRAVAKHSGRQDSMGNTR